MPGEIALHVGAEARAPWRGQPAESRESIGARMPALRPAFLEAAVDVPADVVEGRCDDGDREDVLHRRRHEVLAPGDTGLIGHEADVNQPHDDDRVEVVDLQQDERVEVDLLLEILDRWRFLGEQRKQRRKHLRPPSGRTGWTAQTYETLLRGSMSS